MIKRNWKPTLNNTGKRITQFSDQISFTDVFYLYVIGDYNDFRISKRGY